MFDFLTRLGPAWRLLLPAAAAAGLWWRYRQMQPAARLGLARPRAWRRLQGALALAGALQALALASLHLETALWAPGLALLATGGAAVLARQAAAEVHPGLRGFTRPLPTDGLAIIERDLRAKAHAARSWAWRLAPVLPALTVLLLPAALDPRRWWLWLAVGMCMLAPILVMPLRPFWVLMLPILFALGVLIWNSADLKARLPQGTWTTPWLAARCSARVALAGDGTAWCVNILTREAVHFRLSTGAVLDRYRVNDGWEVVTANPLGAWVNRKPFNRLTYLSDGQAQDVDLLYPIEAVGPVSDELWFIDGLRRLLVYAGPGLPDRITTRHALMPSAANVVKVTPDKTVWVGLVSGVSWREPATGMWRTYGRSEGVRGSVRDLALGPDGTVWLLQTFDYARFESVWLLSPLRGETVGHSVDLARLTGLSPAPGRDAIAVDGLGRVWFTAASYTGWEKFLGVLNPDGSLAYPPFSLGRLTSTDPYRFQDVAYGVLSDGKGGIYLYNGEHEPLRHWRP